MVILIKSRVLVTMDPCGLVEVPCVEGQVRAGNQTHQAIQLSFSVGSLGAHHHHHSALELTVGNKAPL